MTIETRLAELGITYSDLNGRSIRNVMSFD